MQIDELNAFIVEAKAAAYVGNRTEHISSRIASHDIGHRRDDWAYLDSYFGGTDFAGQEVVWLRDVPIWAMNYYGTILRDELIDASQAGTVIKAALAALYTQEARFLGGWKFQHDFGLYTDTSEGTVTRFKGHEQIFVDNIAAYELQYHGGLITP